MGQLTLRRLFLVILLLSGCASLSSEEIHLGGYVPGRYLANVIFLSDTETHERCGNSHAWACTWTVRIGVQRPGATVLVDEVWQVFRSSLKVAPGTKHGAVHELCHAIAQIQEGEIRALDSTAWVLPHDPCHNEDHGRLPGGSAIPEGWTR